MAGTTVNTKTIKQQAVAYVTNDSLYYYSTGDGQILRLDISPFYNNMEVIDRKGLRDAVGNFIESNQLAPARILVLFSPANVFENVFSTTTQNFEMEKKKYLELIPFEHVISVEGAGTGGKIIYALNQDVSEVMQQAFASHGFAVDIISTVSVLGEDFSSLTELTSEHAASFLRKLEVFRKYNYIFPVKNIQQPTVSAAAQEERGRPRSTIMLALGAIGIILIVLGVVIYRQFSEVGNESKPVNEDATVTNTSSVPLASPSPVVTAAVAIEVRVVGSAQSTSSVTQALQEAGMSNIVVDNFDGAAPSVTSVVFRPGVDITTRKSVLERVRALYPTAETRDESAAVSDVVITLSN